MPVRKRLYINHLNGINPKLTSVDVVSLRFAFALGKHTARRYVDTFIRKKMVIIPLSKQGIALYPRDIKMAYTLIDKKHGRGRY